MRVRLCVYVVLACVYLVVGAILVGFSQSDSVSSRVAAYVCQHGKEVYDPMRVLYVELHVEGKPTMYVEVMGSVSRDPVTHKKEASIIININVEVEGVPVHFGFIDYDCDDCPDALSLSRNGAPMGMAPEDAVEIYKGVLAKLDEFFSTNPKIEKGPPAEVLDMEQLQRRKVSL